MAITTGTAVTTTQASTSTAWTVNLPTYSAGDFVLVFVGNNLGSTAGIPTASGWNVLRFDESSGVKGTFIWKKMAGGEGSTLAVGFSGATLGQTIAQVFFGVDATTQMDATTVGQLEASGSAVAAHVTPSITTVTDQAVLVSGFTTDQTCTWTNTTGTDVEQGDLTTPTLSSALYVSTPVTIGSYTRTGTATVASVKAISMLGALRPAAVAAGGPQQRTRLSSSEGLGPRLPRGAYSR